MAIDQGEDKILELVSIDKFDEAPAAIERVECDESICKESPRRSVLFLREHTFLKKDPAFITCPNCLRGVETVVERQSTNTTHLSAMMLLPVCMCAIPYCSKMLRDAVHRCPACGISLGSSFASAREAFVICFSDREHMESGRKSEAQFF